MDRRRIVGGGLAAAGAALASRFGRASAQVGGICLVSGQCGKNCRCCGGVCRCCGERRRIGVDDRGLCVCCTESGERRRRCRRA